MKKIIVTADDYGMCDEVNKAILSCVDAGICKSFNVITNMQSIEIDSRYINDSNISIGLHWNVTAGKPTLPCEIVSSLCDQNGKFWNVEQFQKKVRSGEINIDELDSELKNQYSIFYKLYGRPIYWNTHQNSSFSMETMPLFSKTAKELNIPCTRNFQRVYVSGLKIGGGWRKSSIEFMKKIFVDVWFAGLKKNFKMPDGRIMFFGAKPKNLSEITSRIEWRRKNTLELVIHPATSADNPFFGTISNARVQEYTTFSDSNNVAVLLKQGIEIASYRDL